MTGYRKGTSPRGELRQIREHVALAGAAIQAWADVREAFDAVTELGQLGQQISKEAGTLRAWLAALMIDERDLSQSQLGRILDLSPGRVGQLVRLGRQQAERWGNPMSDPGTIEEQPSIALAIITSSRGVLIEHRRDGIPPWTFPGGEVSTGETASATLARRVPEETGIPITPVLLFGRRVHPRTARVMVYLAATAPEPPPDPVVGDTEDLDAVEWVGLDTVRDRMPDMYEPVRLHLEAVLGPAGQFIA
jgi:8-oxo-dGTP diphosphatase